MGHVWKMILKIDRNGRKSGQFQRMYKIRAKCYKNLWILLLLYFFLVVRRPEHGRAFKCLVKAQQIVLLTYGSFKIKTI